MGGFNPWNHSSLRTLTSQQCAWCPQLHAFCQEVLRELRQVFACTDLTAVSASHNSQHVLGHPVPAVRTDYGHHLRSLQAREPQNTKLSVENRGPWYTKEGSCQSEDRSNRHWTRVQNPPKPSVHHGQAKSPEAQLALHSQAELLSLLSESEESDSKEANTEDKRPGKVSAAQHLVSVL